MQGGPHDNMTAAKAVAFGEALKPEFKSYAQQVVKNAQAMSNEFIKLGYEIVSGGTDNHLMIVDLRSKNMVGKEAEKTLEQIGISVSRSTIPNDPNPPMNPSGIRIGTPAITTRGLHETDCQTVTQIIDKALMNRENDNILNECKNSIKELCNKYPLKY
jgi:glycine hydroxymethyltransferase